MKGWMSAFLIAATLAMPGWGSTHRAIRRDPVSADGTRHRRVGGDEGRPTRL